MSITRTNNSETKPLLRGTLVSVGDTWWPGPGDDEEHRSCTIAVWCPWCKRFHTHGWDPAEDARVASHRVAHCHDPASPFDDGGYFISVWRKSDPEYAGHVHKPGVAIVRKVAKPDAEQAEQIAPR